MVSEVSARLAELAKVFGTKHGACTRDDLLRLSFGLYCLLDRATLIITALDDHLTKLESRDDEMEEDDVMTPPSLLEPANCHRWSPITPPLTPPLTPLITRPANHYPITPLVTPPASPLLLTSSLTSFSTSIKRKLPMLPKTGRVFHLTEQTAPAVFTFLEPPGEESKPQGGHCVVPQGRYNGPTTEQTKVPHIDITLNSGQSEKKLSSTQGPGDYFEQVESKQFDTGSKLGQLDAAQLDLTVKKKWLKAASSAANKLSLDKTLPYPVSLDWWEIQEYEKGNDQRSNTF